MQLLQKNRCFEGEQRIYQIDSQHLKGLSKVGVYLPPAALEAKPCSVLFYLAGLTWARCRFLHECDTATVG